MIGKKLKRDIRFRLVDWQQSLDLVRDGAADIHGGLFESSARDSYLDFSNDLLPQSTRLFVSSKLNARTFADLENVQVGITKGGYETEFVEQYFPAIRLKQYSNNEILVRSALEGEILAFIADYPVGMYYLHKHGSPENFQVVYTLYSNQLKSAVTKGRKGLLQEINTALSNIKKEEKDNITQKWIRTETVVPTWLVSGMIIFVVGLIVVGGFIYAILLKVQVRRKTQQLHLEVDESLRLRSENIELVERLRKQKDEAEQANIAKSKFLAAASHDLRQPLYALTLFTSVLDEEIKYPKLRRVVDQINASVHALQSLFNALLDISRLDAGVMKVEKTDFPLQPLLNKLDNDFTPQAKEKGLGIGWPEVELTVHTDASLFEQVLRNYISNAIRYTNRGEVRISCEVKGELVTIMVSDTGVGIPEGESEAIFDEFHQLSNPERDRSKGLGLGLAIVQRSAELLEHTIDVESEPGKGSTFSITVPQARTIEIAVPSSQEEATVVANQEKPTLILVIDDEAAIREGTQSLMKAWGCQVVGAADKDEALATLRQHDQTPDGIIADYRLRENQTGLEVIQAIHSEYGEHIPALIVTGDIAVERLREVNRSGFQVLHKPVAPLKLRTFLRNVQLKRY